jgi:predicted ATPase
MSERGSFQQTFARWGGFDKIANFSGLQMDRITLTYEFNAEQLRKIDPKGFPFQQNPFYKIDIQKVGNSSYFLSEKVYTKRAKGQGDFIYLQMSNGRGLISERSGNGPIKLTDWEKISTPSEYTDTETSFKGNELVVKQAANDPKRFFPLFSLKRAIEKMSIYSYFDTTESSELRQMGEYLPETQLLANGSNLSQILQRLSINYPLVFDEILKWINKINPNFKDLRFDYLGSRFALILTEAKLSRSVTLEGISDGTLRFLLMLSILCNPERSALICIDEPEVGLHPDMISNFSSVMRQSIKDGTQIILSTHSPMLLNMFDLEHVWIIEKDDHNRSQFLSKTEEELNDWVDEFLPGKLWLQGFLGGRR